MTTPLGMIRKEREPTKPEDGPSRRWLPAVIGVVTAVIAIGVFVALTPTQARSMPALALKRMVPAGSTLEATDLEVVSVPANAGVRIVAPGAEGPFLGRKAAVTLEPGQLLGPNLMQAGVAREVTVGLALGAGEYPPGLAGGQQVYLLLGQGSQGSGTSGAVIGQKSPVVGATVSGVQSSSETSNQVLVDVEVPNADAIAVASAAAQGGVVVVGR